MAGKGTPATLAAERAGIDFAVHEYTHDPAAPAYGPEAAERLGQDPERVLKTLVVSVDGRLVVSCIPVGAQLDLKAVAAAAGGRKAVMAERAEAERATGYVAGGISPLGQRRPLPALVERAALRHATVFVSAGRRGLELELSPDDLIRLTGATAASISRAGTDS